MKKLFLSLALLGFAVACSSTTTTEVTDTSTPALECTTDCEVDCALTCEESGKTFCSAKMEAYHASCEGKDASECSAATEGSATTKCSAATECSSATEGSEKKVCPVTGKVYN